MKTVIIEITSTGWDIQVHDGQEIKSEKWEATGMGAKNIEGSFEDDPDIPEELNDAIDNLGCYDIMRELRALNRNCHE